MKLRWKILAGLAVVAGIVPFAAVVHHFQLKAEVDRYKADLKAKGEPMELTQMIPPPVPPEQNSADTFRHADELFDASLHADKSLLETNFVYGMRMVAPGKAMIRWQQPEIRDIDGTNSWENIKTAVVQNAKAFAMLEQIIEKPAFDFSISYDQGDADLNLTNLCLTESKRTAQRLGTAALCALHQGDTVSATKNLRAMLALVKTMHDERLVISQLVRMSIASIAVTVDWELLQSPNLSDGQLAELQNDWADLEFLRAEENAFAMERFEKQISAKEWRVSTSRLQRILESDSDVEFGIQMTNQATTINKIRIRTSLAMWRYWWSYPDELRMLKGYQILLEATRRAETNHSLLAALNDQKDKLEINRHISKWDEWEMLLDDDLDVHQMLSGGMTSLAYVFNRAMVTEAAKQIVINAIALKRHQLKYGNYPADLNALVPEFISTVLLDPVDGQRLRYRLNADGTYLLYSIGENGVDDGGDPTMEKNTIGSYYWQSPHALDWVWPQPATTEEIQKYYAEQAKKGE